MNNRPKGRQKNISGQGKDIRRRGSGLGTGPVGKPGRKPQSFSGSTPQTFSDNTFSGGTPRRRVTRGGGIGGGGLILILLLFLLNGGDGLGSLLSGGEMAYPEYAPRRLPPAVPMKAAGITPPAAVPSKASGAIPPAATPPPAGAPTTTPRIWILLLSAAPVKNTRKFSATARMK